MTTGPPGKTMAAPGPGLPWSKQPRWSPGAPAPTATALISSWSLREEEAELEVPDTPLPALHLRPIPCPSTSPPPPYHLTSGPLLCRSRPPPSTLNPQPSSYTYLSAQRLPRAARLRRQRPESSTARAPPPRGLLGVVVLERRLASSWPRT